MTTEGYCILDLANDELFSVLSFLPVGQRIIFATSNSVLFDMVTQMAKSRTPYTLPNITHNSNRKWILRDALRLQKKMHIATREKMNLLSEFIKREHEIAELSTRIQIDVTDLTQKSIIEPLSIPRNSVETVQYIQTCTIDEDPHKCAKNQSEQIVRAGHSVTRLTLMGKASQLFDVCKILSTMLHLEKINIDFTALPEKYEEWYINRSLPILGNLHGVRVIGVTNLILNILQMAPNATAISLGFTDTINPKILPFINRANPHLEHVRLKGKSQNQTTLSDEHLCPFVAKYDLETLILKRCTDLRGNFVQFLSQNCTNLKILSIIQERCNEINHQVSDVQTNVSLPHLKKLIIHGGWKLRGDFVDSLGIMIPNVTHLLLNHSRNSAPLEAIVPIVSSYDLQDLRLYHLSERRPNIVHTEELRQVLMKKTNLETLHWYRGPPLLEEHLKMCSFPKLKEFHGHMLNDLEWMEAFHAACPNLVTIKSSTQGDVIKMFLEDPNHWKDLEIYLNGSEEYLSSRPLVQRSKKPKPSGDFVRDWLHCPEI